MCGIAGLMSFGSEPVSRSLLGRMTTSIAHRGPDDSGLYFSPDGLVGLGCRRLSIQDLSPAGHMPMRNEDSTVWVVFNGEIYNFQTLRLKLIRRGHQFRSRTDTEVLLHLYEDRGISFLEELEGMFAIAIWDEKRGSLMLARDRLGEKPLYFSESRGVLRFASEAKSILEDPDFPRVLDLESLNQYLTFGFVLPPRTMFQEISKLAPGEQLVIHQNGFRERTRFWNPFADPAEVHRLRSLSFDKHVHEIRIQLEKSIKSCMVADVPVGAFLSGGVDSSAVVAIMSRHLGRPVESVTVSYPDDACDEACYANEVAEQTGANMSRVIVRSGDAEDCFTECVYHMDEPIADPACVNTFIASKHLRGMGVPVALVGEGADELFLGYPSYLKYQRIQPLWALSSVIPHWLRKLVFEAIMPLLGPLGLAAQRDLLRRAADGEGIFLSTDPSFPDSEKALIVGPRLSELVRPQPTAALTALMQRESNGLLIGDLLSQISFAETRMRMAEQLLMRVDKLSMAHSVEVRAPFLNWHLAQYALSLPGHIRAAGGSPKALLKAAVSDLIPEQSLKRPKMGFGTAVDQWCRGWAGNLLERRIGSSDLFCSGLLSAVEARRLITEHRRGISAYHPKIWNLLCLTEWSARYNISTVEISEQDALCLL
jgi:asparagine synthase (glutamine-hydrolysing)